MLAPSQPSAVAESRSSQRPNRDTIQRRQKTQASCPPLTMSITVPTCLGPPPGLNEHLDPNPTLAGRRFSLYLTFHPDIHEEAQ